MPHLHERIGFAAITLTLSATDADALPSFSRQTGEACTACHVQTWGADLLPRGREFKLNGYTDGDASGLPPISATIDGTLTTPVNPDRGTIGGDLSATGVNSAYKASLIYAGRIVDHLGSYTSLSYQNVNDRLDSYFVDKVDLRFANRFELGGMKVNYGLSVNNQPGLQDLWNTMPAWSFTRARAPELSIGPADAGFPIDFRGWEAIWPTANPLKPLDRGFRSVYTGFTPTLLIDGVLAGNVGGSSLYAMIADWVYLEAGAYASLPRDVQRGIGREARYDSSFFFGPTPLQQLEGGAPYWRIALQHNFDGHYLALGHFGIVGTYVSEPFRNFLPGPLSRARLYEEVTDVGVDATYQYLANPEHIFEIKGTYVRQSVSSWFKSDVLANAGVFESPVFEAVRINAAYTWAQTLGVAFGYHRYMQDFGSRRAGFGFLFTNPDREGYVAELSFTPFGKSTSLAAPWLNLRLNLTYTGDLHGDRVADTMYLNGSLAF